MENKKIHSILQSAVEEEIPSSQIKLWPSIKRNLLASGNHSQGEKMNRINSRRIPGAAWGAIVILIVLAVTLITPQGRAFAQSLLQLFTRADQDRYPLQPWQMTPPSQPSLESPFQLSVQDAEKLAGYDVLSPVEPPFGMIFVGASFDEEHHITAQAFGFDPTQLALSLWQQPLEYKQSCGDITNFCEDIVGSDLVGASADVQTVQVGEWTGEYVEGVWELTDIGPVWTPNPYLKTLRWNTDTMTFALLYMGLDFAKDDLVQLAAGIR